MLASAIRSKWGTPPLLRQRIQQLAAEIRERYDPRAIDSAADAAGIVLVRTSGAAGREAGFAYIEYVKRPELIESLSHPERPILVWGGYRREPLYSIVLNTNAGIPEAEVFWHEWYHLFHSPKSIQSASFEHRYSTEGVLHHQEERRAEEFAAAVLVSSLGDCSTIREVAEQFGVSERLARYAINIYWESQENDEQNAPRSL